jgi:hypothetical protein
MRGVGVVLCGFLLTAPPAFAQRIDSRGVPYRAWDVDAGVGFLAFDFADGNAGNEVDDYYDDWNASWSTSVDVGYFWNTHFKTEAGVTSLMRYDTSASEQFRLPDSQYGFTFVQNAIHQTQVTLAGTWQFFENTFAHPYVSGGVRLGVLDIDTHREAYAPVGSSGPYRSYRIAAVDDHSRRVRARPFVAVGSKSYFNERTFVRPEMVLGFNSGGLSQFGARLVFGVDF